MKKTLQTVLLIFFACTLVFSAWKLLSIYGSYQKGQNSYDDLEQYASFQEVTNPVAVAFLLSKTKISP